MNRNDARIFYKNLDLYTSSSIGKSIFAMTKEEREQYYQSAEHKEKKRRMEEYERKQKEEAKLKKRELKLKYTKKERQEYAKICEEEDKKMIELKKLELEKIQKIKQEEKQEQDRIKQEQQAKLQQKTDKYLKAEYLFYKLFDAIEKSKLINFDLYKDYNLLLPIYNDFKNSPPYNYYLKDIPKRYILDKYFTTNKIQEIKRFEIFNDTEIQELIDIFTYKPKTIHI